LKKKTVHSAEEKKPATVEGATPSPETGPAYTVSVDTGAKPEAKEATASPEPSLVGFDAVLAKVDKGMLDKVDLVGAGDLVRNLMLWGRSVDAKFNMVGTALQQVDKRLETMPTEDSIANKFIEKLKAEKDKALAQRPPTQNQPQEQQQGGGGSEIEGLLRLLGMGEGGGGGEAEKYFIQLGMETASLSNYMTKEMFKTVMPQAFEEWQKGFKIKPGEVKT